MAQCLQISQNNRNDTNSDTDDDDYEEFCENFTFSVCIHCSNLLSISDLLGQNPKIFLQFQSTSTCCVCNGYYAPSFGEPLCGTCHAFLFPVATEEKRTTDLSDNDEDSGNDEPPYKDARDVAMFVNRNRPNGGDNDTDGDDNGDGDGDGGPDNANEQIGDAFERRPPINIVCDANDPNHMQVPLLQMRRNSNDRIAIYENAFLGDRPDPQPPRNLRQYLCALTENHENAIRPIVNNDNATDEQASTSAAKPTNTIAALPVEVLLVIFSYLDDISLCHVGEVCKQWKNILEVHTPQSLWQRYTKTRWPLYTQITQTTNWLKVPR